MIYVYILLSIIMKQEQRVSIEQTKINGKCFRVPVHNIKEFQHYFLPKLDNAPAHHTFYSPQALQQLYKEKNIDLQELKIAKIQQNQEQIIQQKHKNSEQIIQLQRKISKRKRPQLRKNGFTHFIQIPLNQFLRQTYENHIKHNIDEGDLDILVNCEQLHVTILAFKLKDFNHLALWQRAIKQAKKVKLTIKGTGIFGPKGNYANVLYLKLKGIEDAIDRIISKAIQLDIIDESELSYVKFDKIQGVFKAEQPHITILKSKGKDLFDATAYLKKFKDISPGRPYIAQQIKLSIIGSFDGEDFYNDLIVSLDKK